MSSNVGGSSCVDCTFLAGLKKVTNDMKTKNRGDRSGAVPASSAPTEKASAVSIASPKTSCGQRFWSVCML